MSPGTEAAYRCQAQGQVPSSCLTPKYPSAAEDHPLHPASLLPECVLTALSLFPPGFGHRQPCSECTRVQLDPGEILETAG